MKVEEKNFFEYDDEGITYARFTPTKLLTSGSWLPYVQYYKTINWEDMLVSIKKLPKDTYINEKKKTVVLKWEDDTITKVKTSENDKFDVLYGFLLAYFQKHCGMTKNKANRYLEKIVEKEQKK